MLIKNLLSDPDYGRSLRRRLWLGAGFLLVGIVGFVCWFLVVPDSALDDHARSFYLGAASGITLAAVVLLARTAYLLTHPAARKKAQIEETDERNHSIAVKAAAFAGGFTFFVTTALAFWTVAVPQGAFRILFFLMMCYWLSFLLAQRWLTYKL